MRPDAERAKHRLVKRGEARRGDANREAIRAGTCRECGHVWPCLVGRLVLELEQRDRSIARLRQKPSLPEDVVVDQRPRLPRRTGSAERDWKPRSLREQLAWLRELAVELERVGPEAFTRSICDVDEAKASPAIGAGGSPHHEADGSRTGRVPNQVLAHEKTKVVEGPSGELFVHEPSGEVLESTRWTADEIATSKARFLRSMEEGGNALAVAYSEARALFGMSPEDARRLIDPKPGQCENRECCRWVVDEGSDRLILSDTDGRRRCEACSRHFRRYGEERPRRLCHPGIPGVSPA